MFRKLIKDFIVCPWNHSSNNKLAANFSDWKKNKKLTAEKYKNMHNLKVISQIKKMNQPHKGSHYYKNSDPYIIEISNLTKWYANKTNKSFIQVLSNINLKIKTGEFVVILGESGSGKTTLLNILSGLERGSNGQVIIADHNLMTFNQRELTDFRKKYVSIIFQNYSLIPDLKISENIDFGAFLQEDVRKRIDKDSLTKELNIFEQINKFPKQLSGGQQQRASIAKAVAKNPKVLFADEPTGAVDEETCKNILKIFKEINQKYKTTIVLITHNRKIAQISNKVINIKKGKIIEIREQIPQSIDSINWSQHD